MNLVLENLVNEYMANFEIQTTDLDVGFEKFSIYSIMSNEFNDDVNLESVETTDINKDKPGKKPNTAIAIDGVALIVNGRLVEEKSDIDFFLDSKQKIESTYIFIQATTAPSFDSHKLNFFLTGVEDFFKPKPTLALNKKVKKFSDLSNYLLSKSPNFKKNPICKLYYVCTGTWKNDKNLDGIIKLHENSLQKLNYFSAIGINPLGATDVTKLYQKTKNPVDATFTFDRSIPLPNMQGIVQAFTGYLPMSEFKKILVDDNNNLKPIFYDNIRDYYGPTNPINSKIIEALNGAEVNLFPVLNNGITIVTSELSTTGTSMTISDYSIVNGCQTSNILYEFRSDPRIKGISIPIKIIHTQDDDIKNRITIATNSQSAVKREQLQAVTEFQKCLEDYYKACHAIDGLYYERRPNQYRTLSYPKSKIITILVQIKAFGAMFLNRSDLVTNYAGYAVRELVEGDAKGKTVKQSVFVPAHQPSIYYSSVLAFVKLESLFRANKIDSKYKKFKFFILALFGKLTSANTLTGNNQLSEKHCKKICDPINAILRDDVECLKYFQSAVDVLKQSKINIDDKESLKIPDLVKQLDTVYDSLYS